MRKFIVALVTLGMFFLPGCATKPASIEAASVPKSLYVTMGCNQLESEIKTHQALLEQLNEKQAGERKTDILVNLFSIPGFGAATADHEEKISMTKGKLNAMDAEYMSRCAPKQTQSSS